MCIINISMDIRAWHPSKWPPPPPPDNGLEIVRSQSIALLWYFIMEHRTCFLGQSSLVVWNKKRPAHMCPQRKGSFREADLCKYCWYWKREVFICCQRPYSPLFTPHGKLNLLWGNNCAMFPQVMASQRRTVPSLTTQTTTKATTTMAPTWRFLR